LPSHFDGALSGICLADDDETGGLAYDATEDATERRLVVDRENGACREVAGLLLSDLDVRRHAVTPADESSARTLAAAVVRTRVFKGD
jgi:hypothetical protein